MTTRRPSVFGSIGRSMAFPLGIELHRFLTIRGNEDMHLKKNLNPVLKFIAKWP